MKNRTLTLVVFAFLTRIAMGQTVEQQNHYAVIGAFAKLDNAIRYTDKANKNNFSAQYEINPARKLYYVYLLNTPDRKKAFAFMMKMRTETEYKDCWVFSGKLGETPPPRKEEPHIIEPPVDSVKVEKKDSVVFEPVTKVDTTTSKPPEVKPPVKKPDGKPFYFKLVNAESGNEVIGEVHIQESTGASQYQAFRGNEIVYIKSPSNRDGTYTLITNAPGYQQMKTTIVYKEPGVSQGSEGEYIIALDLKRAKRGDYIDFNNVRFVRNSSVMAPESQNELDGLAALMKENMKYKIKIHGHCNGKNDRDIIVLGTSTKFFAMDPPNNKKETTTAKVLSEERAKAVKAYLVSQGISEDRIATTGEGGKIPLYPETSTLASYNDRVEVEIKKH